MCRTRPDIALIILYLAASFIFQVWAVIVTPIPWMNYGYGWGSAVAYGMGAPVAAYLLWRRSSRARLASYTFLGLDIVRSLRLEHWLPLGLSLLIILYLQTPSLRRIYPSMWSQRHAMWHRYSRK